MYTSVDLLVPRYMSHESCVCTLPCMMDHGPLHARMDQLDHELDNELDPGAMVGPLRGSSVLQCNLVLRYLGTCNLQIISVLNLDLNLLT
jgi:hypothetical protein